MIEDREIFKIERQEMAMIRKAYLKEKVGIQRMRAALHLEKQNTEVICNELKTECDRRSNVISKKDAVCEVSKPLQTEKHEVEKFKNIHPQEKTNIQRRREASSDEADTMAKKQNTSLKEQITSPATKRPIKMDSTAGDVKVFYQSPSSLISVWACRDIVQLKKISIYRKKQ